MECTGSLGGGKGYDKQRGGKGSKYSQELGDRFSEGGDVALHLVAVKLDRLFRNTGDAIGKSQEFQRRGINLHLLDVSVDTSTATGKMFFTVLAMLAQFERDITGERTKVVLDMKRRDGKVWNHTPYGYDRVGDALIPNKAEQLAIKRMRRMREKGFSLREIAFEMELAGVKPKLSDHWQATSVRKVMKILSLNK